MLKLKKVFVKPFSRNKTIFVDVDGTLLLNTGLNTKLVGWCGEKRLEGYELILWSARGKAYAVAFAKKNNIENLFDVIISKPGYIVDDLGWDWIKYTTQVRDFT